MCWWVCNAWFIAITLSFLRSLGGALFRLLLPPIEIANDFINTYTSHLNCYYIFIPFANANRFIAFVEFNVVYSVYCLLLISFSPIFNSFRRTATNNVQRFSKKWCIYFWCRNVGTPSILFVENECGKKDIWLEKRNEHSSGKSEKKTAENLNKSTYEYVFSSFSCIYALRLDVIRNSFVIENEVIFQTNNRHINIFCFEWNETIECRLSLMTIALWQAHFVWNGQSESRNSYMEWYRKKNGKKP